MYFVYYYFMMLLIMIMVFIFMNNFLMYLISLEFMLMFFLMMSMINIEFYNDWLFLYLMIMGVCESVIGITLMISMVHNYGNQNMKILNLSW
uniref:NADH dehydrogenase subunit 4L n=1 Tax=Sphecodes ephippius TaxID=1126396 RepID=A0A0S2LTJ2_9HYME|nr:NADH dehydrogenase subunit 4L [Sphecodes ephippius]